MNKIILGCLAAVLALTTMGGVAKTNSTYRQKYESFMRHEGGIVIKPDSMKGRALIYNAQSVASASNLSFVAARLVGELRMKFECENGTLDGINGDWKALKERKGAAAIVIVGENLSTPALLVAPDEQWAVVNVSKLGDDLPTAEAKAKFLPGRVTRQIYRAFALLGGAGKPRNESPSTVRNFAELDHAREALPVETLHQLGYQLQGHGMTHLVKATYRQACQQGWAPAPTNEYQKAIWDNVHSVPDKPLKIEFDPATQKGKVTK